MLMRRSDITVCKCTGIPCQLTGVLHHNFDAGVVLLLCCPSALCRSITSDWFLGVKKRSTKSAGTCRHQFACTSETDGEDWISATVNGDMRLIRVEKVG